MPMTETDCKFISLFRVLGCGSHRPVSASSSNDHNNQLSFSPFSLRCISPFLNFTNAPSTTTLNLGYTSLSFARNPSRPGCVVSAAKVGLSPLHRLKFLMANGPIADRRPIDPPPIVQLRVIDPSAPSQAANANNATPSQRRRNSSATTPPGSPSPSASSRHLPEAQESDAGYGQSFLQNPYYFMFASLAKPDDDAELHWLKVKNLSFLVYF